LPPKLKNTRALLILAAARDEFAKRGFDGARVERIARRARVNKQLVFYYYRSKRGLFQAVVSHAARELEQALAQVASAEGGLMARLRVALDAQFEFLARNPDLVRLLVCAERSETRAFAPAIRRLVVLLAEGQGLGEVRDDLDPHLAAAQALVLMIAYPGLDALLTANAPPLGADEPGFSQRWRDAAVQLVLEGVSVR
jgi:TetR/AcrR family transcriptional regulator